MAGVAGRGRERVLVLVAPERVVDPLVRDDLVQRRQSRTGRQGATQEPAAAQAVRALVRVGLRRLDNVAVGLAVFHNRDFDTSKSATSSVPRIRGVTTVELDGQYRALREEAGMLERGERRLLACRGPDAASYLHDQLTNDVESVEPGHGCYAALLDRKAHLQADLRVLRIADDELLLDCEDTGREALGVHLGTYRVGRDVEFENLAESHTVVSVIGPASATAAGVGPLTPEHAHREITIGGATARAVATDVGIDLICARADLEAIKAALADAGVESVDSAAAEIVRVESGRPRFGLDMTTATIPQEAGINERAVNFEKGCYIGQETVARLHYRGKPNRHLRGLRLSGPVEPGAVVRLGDRELGTVGTAVLSPAHGPIALAILRREAEPGSTVEIDANGATVEAAVVELPFV